VLWSLRARDRGGHPQGVYSRLTALTIKDLPDANRPKLHMTVPPHFRRGSDPPAILILHKALLLPDEILHERDYAVTIAPRAILDVAQSGDASRDLIQQALTEG
jgi:hypothetical protein